MLNFGVDGYGTGQSFLSYRDFEYPKELDHVFYVFCVNDIRNIYENDLFALDETGHLIQTQAKPTLGWKKTVGRFHLTYLLVDTFKKRAQGKRFRNEKAVHIENAAFTGEETEGLKTAVAIFKALLLEWKQTAENNGAKFHVILLPRLQEYQARHLIPIEIETVDLFKIFYNHINPYDYKDWHFENDSHWNEAANQMTAIFLFRFLEEALKLPPVSEDQLEKKTYTYYSSFDGWMPEEKFLNSTPVDQQVKDSLKRRYTELEFK